MEMDSHFKQHIQLIHYDDTFSAFMWQNL